MEVVGSLNEKGNDIIVAGRWGRGIRPPKANESSLESQRFHVSHFTTKYSTASCEQSSYCSGVRRRSFGVSDLRMTVVTVAKIRYAD